MACSGTFSLRSNPSGRITADKREIKDFPKLPSATSFIRKTLAEMHIINKWREK
jgi:hypothetical protein